MDHLPGKSHQKKSQHAPIRPSGANGQRTDTTGGNEWKKRGKLEENSTAEAESPMGPCPSTDTHVQGGAKVSLTRSAVGVRRSGGGGVRIKRPNVYLGPPIFVSLRPVFRCPLDGSASHRPKKNNKTTTTKRSTLVPKHEGARRVPPIRSGVNATDGGSTEKKMGTKPKQQENQVQIRCKSVSKFVKWKKPLVERGNPRNCPQMPFLGTA